MRGCGFAWLIAPNILLICYHLTWSGKQYGTDDEVISTDEGFLDDQDESLIYHGNPTGESSYNPHFGQIRPLHHSQPMNFSAHPRMSHAYGKGCLCVLN